MLITRGRKFFLTSPVAADATKFWRGDGTAQAIAGGGDMIAANNLGDLVDKTAARTALDVLSSGEVLDRVVSRALAERYYFNGHTGTRKVNPLGAHAAGLTDWTLVAEAVEIPAALPAAEIGITMFTDASNGIGYAGAGTHSNFHLGLKNTGVTIAMFGDDSVNRNFAITAANLYNIYAGRTVDIVARCSAGVFSLWVAGAAVTLPTETVLGSPLAWGTPVSPTYLTQGESFSGASWKGRMGRSYLYNCAWSDTEIQTHARTGRHPTWGELGTGSMAAPVISPTVNNGGFETAGGGGGDAVAFWSESTNAGGAITRDTSEFHAGAASCKLSIPSAVSAYAVIYTPIGVPINAGRKYRVELWAKTDGTGGILRIQDTDTSASLTTSIVLTTTWTKYTFEFTAVSQSIKFGIESNNTAMVAFIDDVTVWIEGPLYRDDPDPNYATRDRGANGLHGTLTTGVSYIGLKTDSFPASKVSHAGAGNLQFNGGQILDTSKGWIVEALIVRASAAVTWSLGSASGGAQYVSGYSLAVGDNYIPAASFVTRSLSGGNLWSNSSGAADITIIPILRRTF